MTGEPENKAIVNSFVGALTNQHDPEAWERYCARDFRHHFNVPGVPGDITGIRALSESILAAFPDVRTKIDLLLSEGDCVVERATAVGTHSGNYNDVAPTGERFTWSETHIYRLRDGLIIEHWPEVRLERLMSQMQGRDGWFTGPAKSLQSRLITTAVKGVAPLYRGERDVTIKSKQHLTERNRSVVRRYIDEFKNQQKFLVFPRLFARDFRHHFDFPNLPNSMETFVSMGQNFLSAFPDVRVDVQQLLADDQHVVERNVVYATHEGEFYGITPTGRTVTWSEVHIYRLRDGKIVENWPQVNFERILMQIQ